MNWKIFTSTLMAILYVVVLLACMLLGRVVDSNNVEILGGFILLWMGVDVTMFGIKRKTDTTYAGVITAPAPTPVQEPINPIITDQPIH